PAIVIKFKDFETTSKIAQIRNESEFLEPFIKDGLLDALIIVGSPDPHGADKARSRDGYYGMDLALFLGTFLNYVPKFNVKLDTEVRDEDLNNNLILIGGPVVNKVMGRVNPKLPIRFENGNIKSEISNETYPQDECGLIVKSKNPFNSNKYILVVAGKRFSGTRAAIIAFLKDFKKITNGNIHNPTIKAKVVEGVDIDSDGIIDDIEFRE
ncbi:S-layer protein, partial [Candidatus Woesearchaeota archaeon]|nr:S-layer protein [Candidatus Woesearchaeota archaeon]